MMTTTPRCHKAFTYAKESLPRLGQSHLSSAHLVLGLLTLHGGVADGLLRRAGLSIEALEGFLSTRQFSDEASTMRDGVPLGESAMQAFARAEVEMRRREHTYLGTEHLLLGILVEERGMATELFVSAHINREEMRRAILQEIQ